MPTWHPIWTSAEPRSPGGEGSGIPWRPATVGVISTWTPCCFTAGLAHRFCCAWKPSRNVNCGRNKARMTKTSLKGMGASVSLAISVSQLAQALLASLPTRKLRSNLVRLVDVGDEHANGSCPICAHHERFKAYSRRKTHWGCHAIPAGNNCWMAKFEVSKPNTPPW